MPGDFREADSVFNTLRLLHVSVGTSELPVTDVIVSLLTIRWWRSFYNYLYVQLSLNNNVFSFYLILFCGFSFLYVDSLNVLPPFSCFTVFLHVSIIIARMCECKCTDVCMQDGLHSKGLYHQKCSPWFNPFQRQHQHANGDFGIRLLELRLKFDNAVSYFLHIMQRKPFHSLPPPPHPISLPVSIKSHNYFFPRLVKWVHSCW